MRANRHFIATFVVLTASCGTDPTADGDAFDDGGDVGVDSARDTDDASSDANDSRPLDDSTDAVNDIALEDVASDDGANTDVDATPTCTGILTECRLADSVVGFPLELGILEMVECFVVSPGESGGERASWSITRDGQRQSIAEDVPSSMRVPVVCEQVGVATLDLRLDRCDVTVGTIECEVPTEGWLFQVSWTVDGAPTAEGRDFDVDLHLLRSRDACWYNPLTDLHFGSDRELDWGAPGERSDNPVFVEDRFGRIGTESAHSDRIEDDGLWVVGVEVRSIPPSASATVVATIVRDGESVEFRRTIDSHSWWVVAEVNNDGVVPVDSVESAVPECVPVECDGHVASEELCNGADDDCDGSVDEFPETCLNDGGNPSSTCTYVAPVDEYRCLDL